MRRAQIYGVNEGCSQNPSQDSGLLAQSSPQGTPGPLKTVCPVVDAVSFRCSAVTSWRAETAAHFSKFSPIATLTCSLANLFKAYMTAELSLERKTKLENWGYFKSNAG